ncbi:MAG: hypothetical protein WC342_03520 [Methanoregula sp.]|jgi:hypothetical protein
MQGDRNIRSYGAIIIALIFIGLIVVAIYGPGNQSSTQNQTSQLPLYSDGGGVSQQNASLISKDNLSAAQQKLSTDLLQLTDSRYLPVGMTEDALKQQMEKNHQFTRTETGNALVYVYIKTNAQADLALINSSVWNVTDIAPENHLVVAWMDVNSLTQLASNDFIQSIQSVMPPVTGS